MEKVFIRDDHIKLGQSMKLAGADGSGLDGYGSVPGSQYRQPADQESGILRAAKPESERIGNAGGDCYGRTG